MHVTMIAPDSAGSKGDEGLVRGALNVFSGASITILTTDKAELSWKSELTDRAGKFEEVIVPFNSISDGVIPGTTLVVIGADTVDGTCGVEASLSRLRAVEKNTTGESYVFMSFRNDPPKEVTDFITSLKERTNIHWTCRDQHSVNHFIKNTGVNCEFFPDFAYFCEKAASPRAIGITETIEGYRRNGHTVVGLNYCHHSFIGFYNYSEENVRRYVSESLDAITESVEKPVIVLIPHDVRKWSGTVTDGEFARMVESIAPCDTLRIPDNISYAELLTVIPSLDVVVTGRMHLAVSSFRAAVTPIMFTGTGEDTGYTMVDKCRGMFESRTGSSDMVATDVEQLRSALKRAVSDSSEMKERLQDNNARNEAVEAECFEKLRSSLNISETEPRPVSPVDTLVDLRDSLRLAVWDVRANLDRQSAQFGDVYCKLDAIYQKLDFMDRKLTELDQRLNAFIEGSSKSVFAKMLKK